MLRKSALAAVAAVVGMVAAAKLTAGQHTTLSSLLGLHDDCHPPAAGDLQRRQPANRGAKADRPSFTPAVAHSARGDRGRSNDTIARSTSRDQAAREK
jgi:hypothetical protein